MSSKQFWKDTAPLKDAAILAGWIAALLLIAGLIWFFTQPVRDRIILSAVNQALEQSGDPRRLAAPVPSASLHPGVSRMGFWYTMTGQPEGTKAFIFTVIAGGTFFLSAAVISPEGAVQEFIPLSSHAERMLRRISPEILNLYGRRIMGVQS